MTPTQRRYVVEDAMIGATISAVLSVVFVLVFFGDMARVRVAGSTGLIVDAVPQGAAIALMAMLVPTLLTRRRLALDKIAPIVTARRCRSAHRFVRAFAMAAMGAAITTALTAVLLVAGTADLALSFLLVGKALWGALLGGTVAATMTQAALAEG